MRLPANLVPVHPSAMTAMTPYRFAEWSTKHDGHVVTVVARFGYFRVFCHDCATLPEDEAGMIVSAERSA
jgi:hypothetical protein